MKILTVLVFIAVTFTATAQEIRTNVPGLQTSDTLIIVRQIPCGNCPVRKGVVPMSEKQLEDYYRARLLWRSKNGGKLNLQKDGTYNE